MAEIKVTNINGEYHARLFNENKIILDEMSCKKKSSIGWMCREMLRWSCKMGSTDPHAISARERQSLDNAAPDDVKYLGKFL